jgi:hypothetical protein
MRKITDCGCDGSGLLPDDIRGLTKYALEAMSRVLYRAFDEAQKGKTIEEMLESSDRIHQQFVEEQSRWN